MMSLALLSLVVPEVCAATSSATALVELGEYIPVGEVLRMAILFAVGFCDILLAVYSCDTNRRSRFKSCYTSGDTDKGCVGYRLSNRTSADCSNGSPTYHVQLKRCSFLRDVTFAEAPHGWRRGGAPRVASDSGLSVWSGGRHGLLARLTARRTASLAHDTRLGGRPSGF